MKASTPQIVIFFLLIALLTTSCGAQTATQSAPDTLRFAYDYWPGYYPGLIALDKGYFSEDNLNVIATKPENTDTLMADFLSGKYDVIAVSLGDIISLTQLSSDIAIILASDESAGGDAMLAVPGIENITELRGKQIGVNKGSFAELFIVTLLEKNGMTASDVSFIDMDAASVPQALHEGEVQAAHTWEPYLTEAKNDGNNVLFTSNDTPGLIPDIIAVRGDYLRKNPEAVATFVRGWFRAVDFWLANPQEGNDSAAKIIGTESSDISLDGIKLLTKTDNILLFTPGNTTASIYSTAERYVDFFVRTGGLSKKPDLNSLLNPSFLK